MSAVQLLNYLGPIAAANVGVLVSLCVTGLVFKHFPRGRFCMCLVIGFGVGAYAAEMVVASREARPVAIDMQVWFCILCFFGSCSAAVAHVDTAPNTLKAE